MGRTSTNTQARRVARARLAEKAERRRQREQAELGHIIDFETAQARRAQAEAEMAAAVAALISLGNSTTEAAALTEQTEAEVRRLRKLVPVSSPKPSGAEEQLPGGTAAEAEIAQHSPPASGHEVRHDGAVDDRHGDHHWQDMRSDVDQRPFDQAGRQRVSRA